MLTKGELKEIHRANGAELGGNKVNQAFEAFLENFLTSEVLKKFKENYFNDYLDFIAEFETKKKAVAFEGEKPILLKYPPSLNECMQQSLHMDLNQRIKVGRFTTMVAVRGGRMNLEAALLKVLFKEPVGEIIDKLHSIIESQRFDINTLFLVGGFSESPYVRERIRNDIKNSYPKIDIVKPSQANLHVLKGAVVSVGLDAKIVQRKSRATYGFRIRQKFDGQKHPGHLRDSDGYCTEVFQKIIDKDQDLMINDKEFKYQFSGERLPHKKQEEVWLDIFKSDNTDPVHCKEEGCVLVGRIITKPPESGWPNVVLFDVFVEIRESELHVTVINGSTREVMETTVDFLV